MSFCRGYDMLNDYYLCDICFPSPSGCTFWGKETWSRKKKILWQLGTLVGAPLGIGLVAGLAVPAMIIGKFLEIQCEECLTVIFFSLKLQMVHIKTVVIFYFGIKSVSDISKLLDF